MDREKTDVFSEEGRETDRQAGRQTGQQRELYGPYCGSTDFDLRKKVQLSAI